MTNEDGSVRIAYKYKYKKGVGIVDSEGNQIIQLLAVDCSKSLLAVAGQMLARRMNVEDSDNLSVRCNFIIQMLESIDALQEDNARLVKLVAALEAAAKK